MINNKKSDDQEGWSPLNFLRSLVQPSLYCVSFFPYFNLLQYPLLFLLACALCIAIHIKTNSAYYLIIFPANCNFISKKYYFLDKANIGFALNTIKVAIAVIEPLTSVFA